MNYEIKKSPKIKPCGTPSRTNAFGNLISNDTSMFEMGSTDITITQIHLGFIVPIKIPNFLNSRKFDNKIFLNGSTNVSK